MNPPRLIRVSRILSAYCLVTSTNLLLIALAHYELEYKAPIAAGYDLRDTNHLVVAWAWSWWREYAVWTALLQGIPILAAFACAMGGLAELRLLRAKTPEAQSRLQGEGRAMLWRLAAALGALCIVLVVVPQVCR